MDALPRIPIIAPRLGVSENFAFDEQEPGSTREAQNVRGIDPVTSRMRLAQRSGLNRYLNDAHSGGGKIAEIIELPKLKTRLSWAEVVTPDASTSVDGVFQKNTPNKEDVADIKRDDFGSIYVLQSTSGVVKYNQDGGILATIEAPESDLTGSPAGLSFVTIDEFQNVYFGRGLTSGGVQMSDARLYCFEFQLDGTYKHAWTIDSGRYFEDAVIHQKADGKRDLLCLEADDVAFSSHYTVYENIDIFDAPEENTDLRVDLHDTGSGDSVVYFRRMAKRDNGVVYATGGFAGTTDANLEYRLVKLNTYGDVPTAIMASLTSDSGSDDVPGLGFGVAVGPDNSDGDPTLYVVGNDGNSSASDVKARRIVDAGVVLQIGGTDNFEVNWTTEFIVSLVETRRIRLAVDKNDNLYIPIAVESDGLVIRVLTPAGASVTNVYTTDTGSLSVALACAVPATVPDHGLTAAPTEYVFWGSDISTPGTFHKTRLLTVTQSTGSFREFKRIALGEGNVEKYTRGGSFADITGNSSTAVGVLDANAPYIQATVALGIIDDTLDQDNPEKDETKGRLRAYIVDGKNNLQYDPEDDEVSNWESKVLGIIPPRCRLIETWQGRIVLAGDPENPGAWFLSAINNPNDWDFFPQNQSAAQAVAGPASKIGNIPDRINTLIPWDDDLLIVGCDHSIWMLRGNPNLGGQWDNITDQHGMPWGRPWTKDHSGQVLYYMDTQGGIHALVKGGKPVRISRNSIERQIRDAVNFGTHYVRLVWNRKDEGLHIFQIPFGSGGTLVKHWFWDSKTGEASEGWWPDQFGSSADTTKQPTAVFLSDGDAPEDRVLLMGCEDGRIRAWDYESPNDDYDTATTTGAGGGDNLAIDSFVTIGPIQPKDTTLETQFQEFEATLAYEQSGVHYEWFVNEEPEVALSSSPIKAGELRHGFNGIQSGRFVGANAYLRLRNAAPSQRWAWESGSIAFAAAGHRRRRDG